MYLHHQVMLVFTNDCIENRKNDVSKLDIDVKNRMKVLGSVNFIKLE